MKILGAHLHSFLEFASLRGLPRKEAVGSVFDPGLDLKAEEVMISKKEFQSVIRRIAAKLNDELLGLHVGRHLDFNTLGVVHKISLKATTVEEGIFYCQTYLISTFPYITINNKLEGNSFSISISLPSFNPLEARIVLETILTVITRELSLMWGKENSITTHSPFFDERYPMHWRKGKVFKVVCKANILAKHIKDISPLALDVLIPSYLRVVERMKPGKTFKSSLKCIALSLATPSLPSIDRVASQYNCHVRTLQRKLTSHGITYRQIMEEIKMELSKMLIRHQRFSIGDISSILGYSEPAAFVRSFRKWHGDSPLQFRKRVRQD